MAKTRIHHVLIIAGLLVVSSVSAQNAGGGRARSSSSSQCQLNGTYRIDVAASDKLYTVVKNAKSTVPFAEQQRFFMDLSTRLTPPDMLGIECKGDRVTVGSSRANKITYLADGRTRRERVSDGSIVNSKV